MASEHVLTELAAELAKLYSDSESAKRLVDEAGIPATYIEFDGPSIDLWHRIVSQADKRQKIPDLLRAAIRGYPQNVTLQRIYGAYLYGAVPARVNTDNEGSAMSREPAWNTEYEKTRLYERVALLERNLQYLQDAITSLQNGQMANSAQFEKGFGELRNAFNGMREEISDLKVAIAARPEFTSEANGVRTWIIGIGAGLAILIVVLLLLWVRLGMPA